MTHELVFLPLGGVGEIGMNAALYGFGGKTKQWILVDLGLGFAGSEAPGVDVVMPDLEFIERRREHLLGIVITHGHEDHIGALADLWSRLRVPVVATPFAAGLLQTRRLSEPGAPKVPFEVVPQGGSITLGPFEIEFVPVAHSIPESNALAIRTPLGTVLHSGDWKIDPTPGVGRPTDEARLRAIGDEGVLALVSDSTNVVREGVSPSEADVAATMRQLVADAPGRVFVTLFASNVARIRAVAEAALANGREVVVAGRALDRVCALARELGYLDGLPGFRSLDAFGNLPPDRVVALLTGSQGEPRAALARVSVGQHPLVATSRGDRVVFSSRTIPGNEEEVGTIVNDLVDAGVEVITDRTHLVHVSGHPRRAEMAKLYEWIRPKIAVPVHGEALHLSEHAAFARAQGVEEVVSARNGALVRLAPGPAQILDHVTTGRLMKDGDLLLPRDEPAARERQRLSQSGVVSVAVAVDERGKLVGDPDIVTAGVPRLDRAGVSMIDAIEDAVFDVLDGRGGKRRGRDANAIQVAIEKAVRGRLQDAWGKRATVHALVIEV